jgi:hypothetical protein
MRVIMNNTMKMTMSEANVNLKSSSEYQPECNDDM